MTDLLTAGFAAGWAVLPHLPRRPLAAAFDAGATVAARRAGGAIRQLRANLRRVVGPTYTDDGLDRLTEAGMRSYARYWREVFQLPRLDRREVMARTTVTGLEHLVDPQAEGRGSMIALTHSGNWDAAAVVLTDVWHGPLTTVAERLSPEPLYERFYRYRRALGMEVLPLTGGPRSSATVIAQRLRAGRLVCLLGDRDLSTAGVPVTFFGEATTMPGGPATLAARTGAALVPLQLSYTPDGWRMRFDPEIPVDGPGRLRERVERATQRLAATFEEAIGQHPEDWHMLQPLWTADRSEPAESADGAGPAGREG